HQEGVLGHGVEDHADHMGQQLHPTREQVGGAISSSTTGTTSSSRGRNNKQPYVKDADALARLQRLAPEFLANVLHPNRTGAKVDEFTVSRDRIRCLELLLKTVSQEQVRAWIEQPEDFLIALAEYNYNNKKLVQEEEQQTLRGQQGDKMKGHQDPFQSHD
ncbi:unnamed protein product, partial [Amoebophrya sp. A25]